MTITGAWNTEYIEQQYLRWKSDRGKVSRDWQLFFEGFEIAAAGQAEAIPLYDAEQCLRQCRVEALVYRYRDLGHLLACLDPLAACPTDHPLLQLAAFDLAEDDLQRQFYTDLFPGRNQGSLAEILQVLKKTYCGSIGVEYMHLQDPAERFWLQKRMESEQNWTALKQKEKLRILVKLYQANLFERFLQKRYPGQTRFSLEGAEAIIPLLDYIVRLVARRGCQEIILGMAHRGRLNVQTNVLGKPYKDIFCEFESSYDPESLVGAGDVKYHNGYLADLEVDGTQRLRLVLVNNPSHLESVDPVVQGLARARQDILGADGTSGVMPLLIHGDAAFAGQGIVAETLNMSQLEGYSTGGTLHIIINNQIGYTTLPEDARSTRYSTDIAKMLMVPIFHVHGENPEAVLQVARVACDYRFEFGKDVVIDVVCYRRYGHNEGDEPYFTQPQMYSRIKEREPLPELYSRQLLQEKVVSETEVQQIQQQINDALEAAYKARECFFPPARFYEYWNGVSPDYSHKAVKTAVAAGRLRALARSLNSVPEGFSLHPKLERLLQRRLQAVVKGEGIDWANAETLAFASLLVEGSPVRLSGQDSRRGTFSQRHSVLHDTRTEEGYIPLNALSREQAPFRVYDSLLSEAAVLGFEYGYSLAQPDGLILWEAQFGDFANNAQAIIDLYIASGQAKWQRLSGLVLLLPHGFEGLGPEHSSARLERFLQLCADDNLQVCNCSTPAQYFHLLRRQAKCDFRKPLVIMTPKSLLRHPLAVSKLSELTAGHFQEVLRDPAGAREARTVLFCSGKIYYELWQRRQELELFDLGILRLEQLFPFPEDQLARIIASYRKVRQWCWVQEEPENMGAWSFVAPRLSSLVGTQLRYIGRKAASTPAPGFHNLFKREQAAIIAEAVGPAPE